MAGDTSIHLTGEFHGDAVGPIAIEDAAHRILAYCTTRQSGWGVYDLMGVHARREGKFEFVDASTLFLANAINCQVSLSNLADFDLERRTKFRVEDCAGASRR